MNAEISVSIVTFYSEGTNNLIKKIKVLENLLSELSKNDLVKNIFISDNSLDSKFVAHFKSIRKIIYVHNKSNYGYAKGHNISRNYLKKCQISSHNKSRYNFFERIFSTRLNKINFFYGEQS